MKTKYAVKTSFGTFTRSTARTYTHLVVVSHYRAEILEAYRLASLADHKRQLARNLRTIETGQCQDARQGVGGDWDRKCTADFLAEGKFDEFVAHNREAIATLEAQGVITDDDRQVPEALGWCGRADLAQKLAATDQAAQFRNVWIVDVATGQAVAVKGGH